MTENLYTPNCIRTVSGQYVNVFEPDPNTILIEDIAHSLARECRFGNFTLHHYSVAQHCIIGSELIGEEFAFDFLMHDAAEAYLGDMAKPIKDHPLMAAFKALEDNLMKVIAEKFGFRWPEPPGVKEMDKLLLEHEWCNYMIADFPLMRWSEKRAKDIFLRRFKELSK